MIPKTIPSLVKSVRLLALLGGGAMANTRECDPLVLLIFVGFFGLSLKIGEMASMHRILKFTQPVLVVFVFSLGVADFFFLSRSFLLSVAHFLLLIQGIQLLRLATARENLGSVMLSSLMILSASTLAVEWTFFVMLVLFLPLVIWCLLLHTLAIEEEGNPIHEKSRTWAELQPVLRGSAFVAFFVAAICCTFVFMIFPRFNFQGFRGQFLQPVRKTGFTNQVDLRKEGKVFTDDSIVMRVEIDPKDKPKWTGYMRGATLEVYDGNLWKRASIPTQRVFRTGRDIIRLTAASYQDVKDGLRQSVYLESLEVPLLFAAPTALQLKIERPFVELAHDGALQRTLGDTWRIHYEVLSVPAQPDSARSRAEAFFRKKSGPTLKEIREAALKGRVIRAEIPVEQLSLELPESLSIQNIRELALRVVGNARTEAQKVERIADYLRSNYAYTLQLPVVAPDKNPIEQFLFADKKGHCEYFASAMCVMLRSIGIPARIVTGFLSNEWNDRGNYYVIRMKHAHAWVETLVEPDGWIPVDPSPRDDGDASASTKLKRWSQAFDYLNLRWNRYILSYDFEKQVNLIRSFTQKSAHISRRLESVTSALGNKLGFAWAMKGKVWNGFVIMAFVAVAIGLLTFVVWMFDRWRTKERVWFYPTLIRYLEKKGIEKEPSKTLLETIAALTDKVAGDLRFLTFHYYRLRFDPHAVLTSEETVQIKAALKNLK